LQQHALKTQSDILDPLSALQTAALARNVQPLWVVNVIGAEVTTERIDDLPSLELTPIVVWLKSMTLHYSWENKMIEELEKTE